MILVFDVGNTELTIGLFRESELRGHWRIMTDVSNMLAGLVDKKLIEV